MKRKMSEYERFMSLSDAEKDREVAAYDREIDLSELRPLTAADRKLHAKARKRGRPRIGRGAKRIQVTMERGLLARADAFARQNRLTRAQVMARGVQVLLSGAA